MRQGSALKKGLVATLEVGQALDRYLELVTTKKKPTTARREKHTAAALKKGLGGLDLHVIGAEVVAAYRDERLRSVTGSTVRIELALLSDLFRVAAAEWGMKVENPVRRIQRPPAGRGRTRFLKKEEAERLLFECKRSRNRLLYPLVLLLLHSGMRPGEAAGLRWEQVDLEAGFIRLEDTKTGTDRNVPLTRKARKVLSGLKRRGDFVFVRGGGESLPSYRFRRAFECAVKRAGIPDFRMYDLRHTAASYLLMSGVDIRTLAEILGHRTLQMVMRYTHLLEEHKRRAIEALGELGEKGQD